MIALMSLAEFIVCLLGVKSAYVAQRKTYKLNENEYYQQSSNQEADTQDVFPSL